MLGISDESLAAIEHYYENEGHKIKHIVTLWLMGDPNDPVTQLRDALKALEKQETAQTLVQLTSLGSYLYRISKSLCMVNLCALNLPSESLVKGTA